MSFNPNDINHSINLGNYEEFFILYMDNELSESQKEMVHQFLIAHPDLESELRLLFQTKLPIEEFNFNKEELMAENMRLDAVDEELLLYIDNELPLERKKVIELELASNTDYQTQHDVLLQTKLDASETINHPNKKELYRRTKKVVAFKVWLRIAAAILIIAAMGVLYWNYNTKGNSGGPDTELVKTTTPVQQNKDAQTDNTQKTQQQIIDEKQEEQIVVAKKIRKDQATVDANDNLSKKKNNKLIVQQTPFEEKIQDDIAIMNDIPAETRLIPQTQFLNAGTSSSKQIINNTLVTSPPADRKNIIDAAPQFTGHKQDDVADSKKGSFKSLLRKATRMIEKTTGIDATNDENELLIGSLAIKLD